MRYRIILGGWPHYLTIPILTKKKQPLDLYFSFAQNMPLLAGNELRRPP